MSDIPRAMYQAFDDISARNDFALPVLTDHIKQLPGHIATHELNFAGGNWWRISFVAAEESNLVFMAVYGETIDVFVYDQDAFQISKQRAEGEDYDSDVMLSADPKEMGELDAHGLWYQLERSNLRLYQASDVSDAESCGPRP